ncbi:OsmC family protein [Acidithiobacillus sp. MC6.1]|nr:OsmC family protein [Acidithiobacillus sp. MC6.1]
MGQEDTSRAVPFLIESDEPPALLGTNQGPNPVELLLTALAACITVGLTYNAAARGLPIEQLTVELRGTIDLQGFMALSESVRPGFQGIAVRCLLKSPASDQDIQELLEHVKHVSPVYNTVSEPTPVEMTFQRL